MILCNFQFIGGIFAVMGEQDLGRFGAHAAFPMCGKQPDIGLPRFRLDRRPRQVGIDRQVQPW